MMTGFTVKKRQGHPQSCEARLSPHHPPVRSEQCREQHNPARVRLHSGSPRAAQRTYADHQIKRGFG